MLYFNMGISLKKRGFTLLEITIVIIIIGVLASLAMPRYFYLVEYSRSVEAMTILSVWRKAIERCYHQTRTYSKCASFNDLDIEDPTKAPGSHFGGPSVFIGSNDYVIFVSRNTLDSAVDSPGGSLSCQGLTFSGPLSTVALCFHSTKGASIAGSGFYKGL